MMSEVTCADCKERTPRKYISDEYITSGFCMLCCVCVSKRLDAQLKQANAALEPLDAMHHDHVKYPQLRLPDMQLGRLQRAREALKDD